MGTILSIMLFLILAVLILKIFQFMFFPNSGNVVWVSDVQWDVNEKAEALRLLRKMGGVSSYSNLEKPENVSWLLKNLGPNNNINPDLMPLLNLLRKAAEDFCQYDSKRTPESYRNMREELLDSIDESMNWPQ